ncbi:MAG TPA: ferritin-like domain-containing protein [Candidatus Binatia bacterium]|nr:ferritin-like domain-containing protein [Candidatus Binatia bacterium]
MKYDQKNPIPLPAAGPLEHVSATFESTFDWKYGLERESLLSLYEKGKARTWNATEIDWSIDVDIERMARDRVAMGSHEVVNSLLDPPRPLTADESVNMQLEINAWMISQFLHGEQGALLATAKIVMAAPDEEAKWYAANQVADEARHVEVYHRYLTEKLGCSYEVNHHLQRLLDDIIQDSRWDMTYLGMQIMVEGLALAAFGMMKTQMPDEPLIQDITSRIMQDEARHVAFGVLALEDLYRNQLTSAELREREDFVIEATHLMRDRLLMEQVYGRLGWDVPVWVDWAKRTPFMTGFRQMLFSKIVPNLKRLGLLTPRVREEYGKLGLLAFENDPDSTIAPDVEAPEELVRLVDQIRAGRA